MHKHGEDTCSVCIDWFLRVSVAMTEYLFTINSVIRGYHKIGNCSDPCAVAMKRVSSEHHLICFEDRMFLILCLQFGYYHFLKEVPH